MIEEKNKIEKQNDVMSMWDWFITIVILAIPIVGFVMLFVWGFGNQDKPGRVNYCKVMLIFKSISIIIAVIIIITSTSIILRVFNDGFSDSGELDRGVFFSFVNDIFSDREEPLGMSPYPTIVATQSPTPIPTPRPTPEPTPIQTPMITEGSSEPYMEYTIRAGDTLSKISATFYDGENHVAEIVAYNDSLVDATSIKVGQVIKLPIFNSN